MDLGAAQTDSERESTFRFLNEEIGAQHRMLFDEIRGLDTKATVVAGFAAAAISFLLANQRELVWWFALAAYLVTLALAILALWPRRWYGLVPSELRNELSEAAPLFVVGQVAGTKASIYEHNFRKARSKAILWTVSVVFLAAGSGLSIWTTIAESLR